MDELAINAATVWGLAVILGCGVVFLGALLFRARQKLSDLQSEMSALRDTVDYDDVTSARSRRFMRSVFSQESQEGQNALIFIDLDDFKSVNDGYGHKAGDALMQAIVTDLVSISRDNEIVFRIGGDEFGIYLRDVPLAEATERAKTICDRISAVSIAVDGVRVRRSGSVGVARIERGQDFVGALYYADEAQYAAKSAGGNIVRANAGETLRSMIARRTSPRAEDIEKAISSEEVTYHVQPIFDTRAGRAIGVEALLRWQRADGRLMMPHQFLDVMTKKETVEPRPPIAQATQIANAFTGTPEHLFCAFNISSGFFDAEIDDEERWVEGVLKGLTPSRTVFEIVERAAIRDPNKTKALLSRLRAEGVRVALDDFGTGLSNLERLQELDVDIVKIDRRFVQGRDACAPDIGILRALLDMSQDMKFEIIAEGVETQAELDMLNTIGIWNAQGYFLGRPGSAAHWLEALDLVRPGPRMSVVR